MAGSSKYTREHVARALAMAEAGRTVSQIRDDIGVPYRTVYAWVKEGRLPTYEDEDDGTAPDARSAVNIQPPPGLPFMQDDEPQRAHDTPPTRPADGRLAPPPPQPDALDYAQIQEYIAGIYRMAGQVVAPRDAILTEVVNTHADAAAEAWAEWIRSEPRVAAFLQKMMVGTPAGKLIYIHVSMGIGYFFARAAAEDLNRRLTADDDGQPADDAAAVPAA